MPLNEPIQPIDYARLEWGTLPPLNDDTLWAILREEISDRQVNQLLWYYLGYRYDRDGNTWNIDRVAPAWHTEYPVPPDFIEYRQPTVKLTRSIPAEHKQLLKEEFGFKGYKVGEFGPRQTRRATAVSWFLSYLKSAAD